MKRKLAIAASAIFVLSLAWASVASASGPPATNPSAAHRSVSMSARCTPSPAGGSINVQAKVRHATRGETFTAIASTNLTGGVAAVNLRRAGKSFVAVGKIPVPAAQPAGPVTVTVTITYAGATTVLTCISEIRRSQA